MRQWWIDKTLFEATEHIQMRAWASDFERPDTVAVVEKSAYDALKEDVEFWKNTRNMDLAAANDLIGKLISKCKKGDT